MFLLVMMGRISENVTAVALSEIRPKVFLGAHLVITDSISYGFAVMHPPTQSCDSAGTLSYCLSPAPQAAAGAASAFLFQPKRLERDILIDLHLFRQAAFPVCNAIVTFCSSEKKYAQFTPKYRRGWNMPSLTWASPCAPFSKPWKSGERIIRSPYPIERARHFPHCVLIIAAAL